MSQTIALFASAFPSRVSYTYPVCQHTDAWFSTGVSQVSLLEECEKEKEREKKDGRSNLCEKIWPVGVELDANVNSLIGAAHES